MNNIQPITADYKPTVPSFVMARIQPHSDGRTFVPTESGRWAVTLGVDDRDGQLVDFVAYFLDNVGNWWLRRREISVLGAEAISRAEFYQTPLNLYPTPHQWLLARGDGVCVLDWGVNLLPIFERVPHIACKNTKLKSRLHRSFVKQHPKITVPALAEEVRRAA